MIDKPNRDRQHSKKTDYDSRFNKMEKHGKNKSSHKSRYEGLTDEDLEIMAEERLHI